MIEGDKGVAWPEKLSQFVAGDQFAGPVNQRL